MNKIETYRYQVILFGNVRYEKEIQQLLDEKLAADERKLVVRCTSREVDFRLPAAGVYFVDGTCCEGEGVAHLLEHGVHILPVVGELKGCSDSLPYLLTPVNAAEVKKTEDCIQIVNYLLTEFRLLREKKKVFISYCRQDTGSFAHQLYDELNHRGYDAFLDSYSIDHGLDFQEELQEFLADSDIMVFLHSPESAKSRWVQAELTRVNRLQIGVVEVQWPALTHTDIRLDTELTYRLPLENGETHCPHLLPAACRRVADAVDHWRARSMQARVANLKSPLCHDPELGPVTICPSSVVASEESGGMKIHVPVVGLPCAMDYDKAKEWLGKPFPATEKMVTEVCVVYDHLYLKKEHIDHLHWLDSYLPVKSMNIRKLIINPIIMKKHSLKKIFLSASIPLPERHPKYYQSVDVIAIRDAVRALAASVLPYAHLVWGGHPSITPLIREVMESIGVTPAEMKEHVTLYQSRFFEGLFPKDNECVEEIRLTDIVCRDSVEETKKASLQEMRCRMLDAGHQYVAAIFIGGMEGVEQECRQFRESHPDALLLPIASTGAAAQCLMADESNIKVPEGFNPGRLKNDFDYQTLFEELFKDIIEEQGQE